MSTNTPPADARASAWIGAHERIAAAQKLKLEPGSKSRLADPLPEIYWATLAEADVLARLATADQTTGFVAGGYLVGQNDRIVANRRAGTAGAALARERADREAKHRAPRPTIGELIDRRVTVTRGDYAGRVGTVIRSYPNERPPRLVVVLHDPVEQVDVLPADVELVRIERVSGGDQ